VKHARGGGFATAVALAIAAFAFPGTPLGAQSASILARAEVSDVALSVLDVQELDFGTVAPGFATTIDPQASPSAGKFEIRGANRAEITVDVNLPAALTVGPWSMPIAFGANGACHRNRDQQAQCTYFDPSTTLVTRIRNRNFPENLQIVWIGGTVSPAAAQFPGVYRGTITLTAAYTGN
jgi:hypothetical protein